MASSTLDPSFGQAGVVLGTVDTGSSMAQSNATAVAVQADGKIVVAGTDRIATTAASVYPAGLDVRRYNADGSLDTTFGTDGQAEISLPSGNNGVTMAPRDVLILGDGSIVLAAAVPFSSTSGSNTTEGGSLVAKLTPSGQPDSTFGTAGEVVLPLSAGSVGSVAVQADGKLVLASGTITAGETFNSTAGIAVTRLTAAGGADTSFNGTGELDFALPRRGTANSYQVTNLLVSPTGQILIAGNLTSFNLSPTGFTAGDLARVTAAGALDTTFGSDGILDFASSSSINVIYSSAIQPDGRILLSGGKINIAGTNAYAGNTGALVRLLPAGTVDPSFVANVTSLGNTTNIPIALAADGTIAVAGTTQASTASTINVEKFLATGAADTAFGIAGRTTFAPASPLIVANPTTYSARLANALAFTPGGDILVAGQITSGLGSQSLLAQLLPIKTPVVAGDYDGDGKSDFAAELAAFGLFAVRQSTGGDVVESFGPAGTGAAIPAPGDYDGDGKTDIAAYLPAYGVLAYRPSSGGADVFVSFGVAGAGASIPAPGDYDGDGKTDVAVYLPAYGVLAYRPSSGGADVLTSFGTAGAGMSVPAPGDYDGDGKTDVAVYLPAYGVLAYRPSSGGADVLTSFGSAGAGASIPAPGDYDGDGKTDVAVYLPAYGVLAYRPSSGGADVLTSFGTAGVGQSIPAPGDYDGDGKTDVAVYLPTIGYFADRPSSGGADVIEQFGAAGAGQTVPASSIPAAQQATVAASSLAATPVLAALALTDDVAQPETLELKTKHKQRLGSL